MAKIMSNLNSLEIFDADNIHNIDKRWGTYRDEVDLFLQASGITQDTQKRAILLHSSGKRVREIFSTLTNTGTTYKEACDALDAHFKPHKNIIYDRWIFRNAKQLSDETAAQFIVRLRKLVENCEYTNADEEIRDQFVCGCHDRKLMEKLLSMPKLTIGEVAETSLMYENARLQSEKISESRQETVEQINRVTTKSAMKSFKKPTVDRSCYNCGNVFTVNHKQICPAKDKICNFCGIMGHFQSVCRKAKKVNMVSEMNDNTSDFVKTDVMSEDLKEHIFYLSSVFSVSNKYTNSLSPHFKVCINNKSILLMGDTGATCSCINYKTYLELQKDKRIPLSKTKSKIFTFGNKEPIKPIGMSNLLIEKKTTFVSKPFMLCLITLKTFYREWLVKNLVL